MKLAIRIFNQQGKVLATQSGEHTVHLCYNAAYEVGDTICIESDQECYLMVRLEDSMPPAFVYLKAAYQMEVPFERKRISYSPKSFTGACHLLEARTATEEERSRYKNLACNPYDCHENQGMFPHALANVETRGEAVFAARNAIDGNIANHGHGPWPFESWGINQQEDAEFRLEFGRDVHIDKAVVTLRADFPHDNWWQEATLRFSDGSRETLHLTKSDLPQEITFSPRVASWIILSELKKNPEDPSPFPALTQLELWGHEFS